ncbi:maltose acetyltransferase domain-containing protein [Lactococcus termiticola]|uniref:Sugar O-acetyltransferase n=1 Tax=Lactococcus termiticola TaxID=2169526 RepID=A0A2R5HD04_9LACT|nr:maltose acetyltransferase domain-containing protein [Lactococcus termiticola]GBG95964.1 sugar O-acetyltransferase [Lactococcus termiticola]
MKKEKLKHQPDGVIYDPADPALIQEQQACQTLMEAYNQTTVTDEARQQELLQQMFAEVGEDSFIQPGLMSNN